MLVRIAAPMVALACIAIAAIGTGCERRSGDKPVPEAAKPMKTIDDVIKQYSDSLMGIPGVVGLYHGLNEDGSSCLKVMVKKKTPELEKRLPKSLEGFAVVIDETGEIKPMR